MNDRDDRRDDVRDGAQDGARDRSAQDVVEETLGSTPSWPEDEALPSAEEFAAAAALSAQMDLRLAGSTQDMSDVHRDGAGLLGSESESELESDAVAFATMAGMVHAAHHPTPLGRPRRDAILDEAFREVDARRGARSSSRRLRWAPLVAVAASVVLAIGVFFVASSSRRGSSPSAPRVAVATGPTGARVSRNVAADSPALPRRTAQARRSSAPLPSLMRSRPSDDLLGHPIRDRGAGASRRLDKVFASRLAGLRALRGARWAHLEGARRRTP
ncbi:MAG: hypothetical protein KAI47_18350 [Deltaproteobacteria bacterium]|nr:hypothetical protein [Deltaproteobacteria bacterium]